MIKIGLTENQRKLLNFITDYISKCGQPPTVQEMADGIGLLSKSGVVRLLVALEQRGWITRLEGKTRAITVLKDVQTPAAYDLNDPLLIAALVQAGWTPPKQEKKIA